MRENILSRNDRVFLFIALAAAFVTMFMLSGVPAGHAAPSAAMSSVSQPLQLARVHVLAGRSMRSVPAF